jgi:hypothetical protein
VTVGSVLIPLRVPELGPYMSKIVTGTGRAPGGLPLDAVRLQLATRVFQGGGEARRLAAREQRDAAVAAVGPAMWLEAWDEAIGGVADLMTDHFGRQFDAEANVVRLPRRGRRRVRPNEAFRRAVRARLGSAGAALVATLDGLEQRGANAVAATGLEREAIERWQETLCTAARRLEAAWLDLESTVESEARLWQVTLDEVAQWRRPLWPVMLVGGILLVAATWLGLVLSGYVLPPPWFAELWQRLFVR